MTTQQILQKISKKYFLDELILASWWDIAHHRKIETKNLESFLLEHIDAIKAQPIVKWVGGKRQLIPTLKQYFPKDFGDYHEPFLGGGAVFFNLQKRQSHLSDVNEELINMYKVVKDEPLKLIKELKTYKYEKEFFLQIRSWDRETNWTKKYTTTQRAARFIYLNRTCFNGLYRVNSHGHFNVPFGAYKNPDFVQEKNIINASRLLHKTDAIIKHQSFEKVINEAKIGDFVYLDPPYDTLSETANFTSYVKEDCGKDLQYKLAEVCKKLHKKWVKFMLSNHNTPLIQKLYKEFTIHIVHARRNVNSKASGRGNVEEVVVVNY